MTDPAGANRGWISVFVAVLFVITVSGVFAWAMRDDLVQNPDTKTVLLTESFGHSGEFGGDAGGSRWTPATGEWGVDTGKAIVTDGNDLAPSIIVTTAPNVGTIGATIGGTATCGIVVRYRSPSDYVALHREPEYGVWNLIAVTSRGSKFLGNLPDSPLMDVHAELTSGRRIVEAAVLGESLTVVLDEVEGDSSMGLIGIDDVASCTWDDVTIASVP